MKLQRIIAFRNKDAPDDISVYYIASGFDGRFIKVYEDASDCLSVEYIRVPMGLSKQTSIEELTKIFEKEK